MTPSQLTLLLVCASLTGAALTGCSQNSASLAPLTASEVAAQRAQTDKTIAMIQASKGTPEQKAQAIGALRVNIAQTKS